MNLQGRELRLNMQGDDVAALHQELTRLGRPIDGAEVAMKLFGGTTRTAILELQQQAGLPASGVVDQPTVSAIGRAGRDEGARAEPQPGPGPRSVSGHVVTSEGVVLPATAVEAVGVSLAGEVPLGRTTTGNDGSYLMVYDASSLRERGKAAPDILVRALRGDGEVAATSAVRYNADEQAVIDVVVPAERVERPDEYTRLTGQLGTQLVPGGPARLAELREGDDRADVSYLANKTGWDARMVAMAALADRLAEQTDIPAYFHYALLRAGLPADEHVLLQADPAVVRGIWESAVGEQLIPAQAADQIESTLERFRAAGMRQLLTGPPAVGPSSISALLEVSGLTTDEQERFAALYQARGDDPAALWEQVGQALGTETAQRLQLNGKLAFLTVNNAPLISALHAEISLDDPVTLVRNGFYDPGRWTQLLGAEIPVPTEIPGEDDTQRRANYAELMADQLRISYPTAVVAERVRSQELPLAVATPVRGEVYDFLTAQQGAFELGVHPVEAFLRDHGAALSEPAAAQVRLLQRVYQLSPTDEAMRGMLSQGLDSAHAMVQYDQPTFVRMFGEALGGEPAAQLAHAKATQVRGTLVNLVATYLAGRTEPPIASLAQTVAATDAPGNPDASVRSAAAGSGVLAYPTLEGLFGAMDFCACPLCRSLLSPAAYLVDLLDFLDLRRYNAAGVELPPSYVLANPLDVLLGRRPDLAHLQLTCENTNTVLPTVDLVAEPLEYLVAHGFTLAGFTGFNVPEGVDVAAESANLLAEPRYVSATAYTALADAPYPLVLPFHRPLVELRAYLAQGGVVLADAMVALRAGDDADPPAGAPAAAYRWRDICSERLGLSRREYALLTDHTIDLRTLYGEDPAAVSMDVSVAKMSNAVTFARTFSLDYDEVIELVRTRFVNPSAVLLPKLERLGVSFTDIKRLHDGELTPDAFTALLPVDLDPAAYGGDVVAWVAGHHDALMGLIVLADPSGAEAVCAFDQLELRRADPDMAANRIDAAALLRLVRLVRLRARLGWTMAQTDAAIAALWPALQQPDSADTVEQAMAKLDRGMAEVVVRLGHLTALLAALHVSPARELGLLLACWSPLDTYGPDAPYRRLFLTPAAGRPDPVFAEDGFGNLPNPTTSPLLLAHADALRAGIGVTAAQFAEIVDALGYNGQTPLTLDTISAVVRYGFLARKLRMSPAELHTLTELSGINPFEPLSDLAVMPPRASTPAMARLVDLAALLRGAKVRLSRLRYLLAHDDPVGTASPRPADVLAQAAAIRADLLRIEASNGGATTAADPTGEAARTAMALVYGADVADTFFGLLLGTTATSVPYAHDQAELPAALTAAAPALGYDDFAKQLSYQGVMTAAVRDVAVAAAAATQPLVTALLQLYQAGQRQVADFFDRFPDLAGLYMSYADSTAPPAERLAALLADFLPALRDRLKRAYLRQSLATETSWTPADVATVVEDSAVLRATDSVQPAIADLLGLTAQGLTASYWLAADTSGTPTQTVPTVATIDYADGSLVVLPQRPDDPAATVSGDWRGYLAAPDNGLYKLSVLADDGATLTLSLDGRQVPLSPDAAGGGAQGITAWRNQQPIELAAGVLRGVRLTVTGVRRRLALRWEAKGLARTVIPADALYPAHAVDAFTQTHLRLLKAVAMAELVKLSPAELRWSATRPEYAVGGRSWLDALPVAPTSATPASALFAVTANLLRYTALREDLTVPDDRLLRVLTDPTVAGPDGRRLRVTLRDWDEAGLADLLTRFGLVEDDLHRVEPLGQVVTAMGVAARLGVATTALLPAVTNAPDDAAVTTLQAALRARYDEADWQRLLQPINDELRARRRDALVGFVLHGLAATPATAHVDTADKLYEHLLIDVATDPCTHTSRIRQAIATVQLFTQRCLLHLEPEVDPSSIVSSRWEWMKHYPLWATNRRVFLSPELWLDPRLRDDKSSFFRDLESELLGADLTDDAAARALGRYLDQLTDVAKLETCGMYLEENDLGAVVGTADDVVHVVARTAGAKRRYYYRRYEGETWTPWERIGVEIQDNPVLPVVWGGRTLLFWLGVTAESSPTTGPSSAAAGTKLTDVSLNDLRGSGGAIHRNLTLYWSEYTDGKWQPATTSDVNHPMVFGPFAPEEFDRAQLRLDSSVGADGELVILVRYQEHSNTFVLYNTHSVPVRGDELPKGVVFTTLVIGSGLIGPIGPIGPFPPILVLTRRRSFSGTTELYADYLDPGAEEWAFRHKLLANAPLHEVVDPHHPVSDLFQAPFFVQDRRYAFYVTPVVSTVTVKEADDIAITRAPPVIVVPQLPPVVVKPDVEVPVALIAPRPPQPGPLQPGVVDPTQVRAFLNLDPNIRTAIGSGGTLRFDGIEIGPGGALGDRLR
jgi:hypothetical protein